MQMAVLIEKNRKQNTKIYTEFTKGNKDKRTEHKQ